ncbi:hypothetical protein C7M84_014010 [Penaeus vannamei]|uniref:Uncharacterized protein n=1 Tax=Penaeus vannamei TaxID=6689 RepID=A0A3R7PIS4_PENVA|nr:hypothetical protein C7M84_014010 [Penaeus vannamei]
MAVYAGLNRVGFDIKDLLQEQHAAREQPEVFPPWFLKRFDFEGESTCSDFSTQRGKDQRVLAYSYYTTNGSPDYFRYLSQLHGTAKDVERLYPGWIMRIYHNTTSTDVFGRKELCRLYCENDHVDLCHIHDLPGLGNLNKRGVVGRMWRFAVMGDPTVEVFLSRDADSWVLDREAAAVHEWLRSGRSFHVMHDHPVHRALMMAGLWGAFNKNQTLMRKMRDRMFNSPRNLDKAYDQRLLLNIVWPVVKNDVLNHDSYTCLHPSHINATPFPTKREDNKYCGWGISKGTARRKLSKKSSGSASPCAAHDPAPRIAESAKLWKAVDRLHNTILSVASSTVHRLSPSAVQDVVFSNKKVTIDASTCDDHGHEWRSAVDGMKPTLLSMDAFMSTFYHLDLRRRCLSCLLTTYLRTALLATDMVVSCGWPKATQRSAPWSARR